MDLQTIVDSISAMACVVSVEKVGGESYGKIRIVTGNRQYIDSIEKPFSNVEMLTKKFIPNSEYTNYLNRDLNFEDSCYQAAVQKKCLHSYAHPTRFDVWFNMSFIPLSFDNDDLCYCLYIMEINFKPDAKRMSTISADIATAVLETCIKLRSPDNFKETMKEVCADVRDLCDSEYCCILLTDTAKRKCSVLCEAFSDNTDLISMSNYVDDKFYDIAYSWLDTIAGSNCIIAKNDHDWAVIKERNPIWYDSVKNAGGKTIVLFPLEFKGELLGFIWALNFNAEKASMIKETLELTTFILSSELYSYNMLDRLHILSSRDMLTGVMNRNEMNNYVDELVKGKYNESVGVIFADLNGLKVVNDTDGHIAGDTLLKNAASALKDVFRLHEIFRAGGDEFVAIITGITENELNIKADLLRKAAENYNELVFAIGTAYDEKAENVRSVLHIADERMYKDKKLYYELHPEKKHRVSNK